jgi:hypothetical protein
MAYTKTSTLLKGFDEVEARLDKVADAADDMRDVWPEIGRLWADRQNTVFATDGLGKWGLRAASTIAEGQSPLVDTGVMREGVTNAPPIWAKKYGAAWGANKADRRVMNIAVLNTVGHKSRGASMVPPRVVVPPLRPAERKAWIGLVAKHMHKAIHT